MASNSLPKNIDDVSALAEEMAEGLRGHESAVGVMQNTESRIRAALADARNAASAALAASAAAKDCASAQAAANVEARDFIGSCRKVLSCHLGNRWAPSWTATGFPSNSTAIPKSMAERQSLAGGLRDYLAAHPAYENVPLRVTAERAAEVFDALRTARLAATAGNSAAVQANEALEAARQTLRMRMSGLIFELGQLLADDDPRWTAFGLKRPADPAMPATPQNLKLSASGDDAVHASWSVARRATRYRLYVKQTGEAEFTARLSTWEPNALVKGLGIRGGTVWIQVSAVNDAGESAACEPVEFAVKPEMLAGQAA